jgi:hypothetical protein
MLTPCVFAGVNADVIWSFQLLGPSCCLQFGACMDFQNVKMHEEITKNQNATMVMISRSDVVLSLIVIHSLADSLLVVTRVALHTVSIDIMVVEETRKL